MKGVPLSYIVIKRKLLLLKLACKRMCVSFCLVSISVSNLQMFFGCLITCGVLEQAHGNENTTCGTHLASFAPELQPILAQYTLGVLCTLFFLPFVPKRRVRYAQLHARVVSVLGMAE